MNLALKALLVDAILPPWPLAAVAWSAYQNHAADDRPRGKKMNIAEEMGMSGLSGPANIEAKLARDARRANRFERRQDRKEWREELRDWRSARPTMGDDLGENFYPDGYDDTTDGGDGYMGECNMGDYGMGVDVGNPAVMALNTNPAASVTTAPGEAVETYVLPANYWSTLSPARPSAQAPSKASSEAASWLTALTTGFTNIAGALKKEPKPAAPPRVQPGPVSQIPWTGIAIGTGVLVGALVLMSRKGR